VTKHEKKGEARLTCRNLEEGCKLLLNKILDFPLHKENEARSCLTVADLKGRIGTKSKDLCILN
jgi:hypothetical protein